jgi:glycosyltransferase involved in cell wall biosynthesis
MTRTAVVVGFSNPARYLARLMNTYSTRWRFAAFPPTRLGMMHALFRLRNADALISFGGPGPNAALTLAAHHRRVPLVVIWAGTDVLVAASNPSKLEVTKRETSADLAVSPWLAEELQAVGVPAVYQPLISAEPEPIIAPFPKRFTVLNYLPTPRRAFYGEELVYAIAREMTDTRFVVVGPGPRNDRAPENVQFLGQVTDINPVLDVSHVLLRLPQHDGQSMMVLEAMARGRHVVWNYDIPGVHVTQTPEDALAFLRVLRDRYARGVLNFNLAGREYVAANCSPPSIAAGFEETLNGVVPRRIFGTNGHRKRVAISGYGLFCADAAKNIEQLHPDWEAQILRPSSRTEVLTALFHLRRADVWYSIGSHVESRWMHYTAQLLGIPRVMHWVGSDIEAARSNESIRRAVELSDATHLTEIDWTAKELAEMGFRSQIAPLPARHGGDGVKPLPDRFTILLYIPESRPEFYGAPMYERLLADLAEEAPRVFVVGGAKFTAPRSVEVINFGWRSDLRPIYEQSTVLIRQTCHDGLALMVLEALLFGRYVIWPKPFPDVIQACGYDELVAAVCDLLRLHKSGDLRAQYTAAERVRSRYSAEHCVEDLLLVFETARRKRRAIA